MYIIMFIASTVISFFMCKTVCEKSLEYLMLLKLDLQTLVINI